MLNQFSDKSIGKILKLYAYSDAYDIPLLRQMCDTFIQLRVSKDRKGRTEAVSMAQAILGMKRLDFMEKQLEGNVGKK